MKAGQQRAEQRGVPIHAHERIDPLGTGWVISSRAGFAPCPWALDLIEFARPRVGEKILDLGCGSAPLAVAIGQIEPAHGPILGVDLSWRRLDQGRRNLALQNLQNCALVRSDIRCLHYPPIFDLVLSNPPFYPVGWGRMSDDPEISSATHAVHGDIPDFLAAACDALAPHGRIVFIYDTDRLPQLLIAVSGMAVRVKEMRFLYDDRHRPSRVMIMIARGGGLVIDHRGSVVT